MTELSENLFIGSYADACNEQFLRERRITHIMGCGPEFQPPPIPEFQNDPTRWYQVRLVDSTRTPSTLTQLLLGASKLRDWLDAGHRVLVHCLRGDVRSTTVIMNYYILFRRYSFDQALRAVRSRRHIASPCPTCVHYLRDVSLSGPA